MALSADARARWIARFHAIGLAACGVGALVLLTYVVGSLALTGGRMGRDLDPLYGQLLDWPLFQVPAWLVIAIGIVAFAAFVPMAALVGPDQSHRIPSAFSFTVAGVVLLSLLSQFAFPTVVSVSAGGVVETEPGLHWIGIVLGVATIAAMLLLGGRAMTEHDRRRRG
ncbi:hypothetical protein SAMN04487783_0743 [Agrococcus baldri]|uniref:Uncharacterized protein n=1 Tax=Agrococcus baldri TaxID=153730 RepID=A0AA94HL62_9MICO|nr:hypothetical protein [Agrococcus baldri]SFS03387.1 hypothetical protein SAMN04487783_0743 [Agrococcus baldri]